MKLSEIATLVWNIAGAEALSAKFEYIEREHLLIGVTEIGKLLTLTAAKLNFNDEQLKTAKKEWGTIEKLFFNLKLDVKRFRRELRANLGEGKCMQSRGDIHRSTACKNIFDKARAAAGPGATVMGLDLIKALMRDPGPHIPKLLAKHELSEEKVIAAVHELEPAKPEPAHAPRPETPAAHEPPKLDALLKAGDNLTEMAKQELISPCVGRADELALIEQLFADGGKLPLLIAEEGVGKTALVETLALKATSKKAAAALAGKTIIALGPDSVFNSEGIRGDILIKNLIEEADAAKNVIIYIKQLHRFFSPETSPDAGKTAALLKDALLSRAVPLIASTDEAGCELILKEAPELAETFEKIFLAEPSKSETMDILREWQSKLEAIHELKITDKALSAAIELGAEFKLPGRLPKKAIDLLDSTCAAVAAAKLEGSVKITDQMQSAAKKYSLDTRPDVNELQIAAAVAQAAGRELDAVASRLSGALLARLLNLETELKKEVFGQEEAIAKISKRILISSRLKHKDSRAPLLFWFTGPKGVGKTCLAKRLPMSVFEDAGEPVICDLEQYSHEESVKRLFDSQNRKGILTSMLAERPARVMVFENADQSHPVFYEMMLPAIKRGELAYNGGTVSIAESILVFTSTINPAKSDDPAKTERHILKHAYGPVPDELKELISDTIVFKPLKESAADKILNRWITGAKTKLNSGGRETELNVDPEAVRFIVEKGLTPQLGAKSLKLAFDEMLGNPLDNLHEKQIIQKYRRWNARLIDNEVTILPDLSTSL